MPPFDRDLVDPQPDALVRVMTEAVEMANKRCRVGKMTSEVGEYHRFAKMDFADRPEGVRLWLAERGQVETYPADVRATLLGLAWWTNPLGRRLVRVVGRRVEPGNASPAHRFGAPDEQWPALCYLDPDHMVLRTLTTHKSEVIALCGCGAVGSPADLAWMGGSCGPCHDHREEHGTPLRAGDGPVVLRAAGWISHVAFSPSGRTVVAVVRDPPERYGPPGKVCFWERATGTLRQEHGHDFYMGSPDTPFAAGGNRCVADGYSECTGWDLETGQATRENSAANLSFLALAPDGRTLAGVARGPILDRDLEADTPWMQRWSGLEDYPRGAIAFSPDGKLFAVGIDRCRVDLLDWNTGKGPTLAPTPGRDEFEDHRVEALAFSPDGALLAAASAEVLSSSELEFGLTPRIAQQVSFVDLYDVGQGSFLAGFYTRGTEVCAVAFSPDGKLLLFGGADRLVHFVDVSSRKERATLAGPLGTVQCLAFSPDGTTLAVGGGDGVVRFWPWRQLLDRSSSRNKQ
jgi:WD40 repeat protein